MPKNAAATPNLPQSLQTAGICDLCGNLVVLDLEWNWRYLLWRTGYTLSSWVKRLLNKFAIENFRRIYERLKRTGSERKKKPNLRAFEVI